MGMDLTSTVLVVDDDVAIREALKELLAAEGYNVACASNGAEALARATQLTPDLILLDVVMPDMDGLTVCQRLRADPLLAEVPIIMVTSLADRTSRLRGFEAGADDYVSKPFDTPELLARVRTTTRLNRYRRLLLEQTRRQQAEAALRESEARLRNIADQSNDGILLTDEQGAVVEWNRGAERIFGLQRDEVLGRSIWDIQFQAIPEERRTPTSYEQLKTSILESLSTGQAPWLDQLLEIGVQRPDGEHRFVQSSGFRIQTDQGFMLGSISRDITERKQAEQALGESEIRYRTLFHSAHDAIFLMRNDQIIDCNRASEAMFGRSRSDIVGGTPYQFSPPHQRDGSDSKEKALEKIDAALAGTPQSFEWAHCLPDGTVFDTEVNLSCMNLDGELLILAIVRDITERKQAEKALRRERDRAQMYLDVTGVIMLALSERGEIVLINHRGCQILGYEEKTLIGQNWFDACLPASIREEARSVFEQLMEGEVEGVEYFENAVLTSSGEERIIAWHNTILRDEAGRITGTLSSGEDITERKQAENEIRERLQFERLMAKTSARFVSLEADQIDTGIAQAFAGIGAHLEIDRIVLWELSRDKTKYHISHSWAVEGTEMVQGTLSTDSFPYIKEKLLKQGEPFVFSSSRSHKLPEQAFAEKQYYEQQGIQSSLVIPLTVAGDVIGGLSLSTMHVERSWTAEAVQRVLLLGQVLANALIRKRTQEALRLYTERLEILHDIDQGILNARSPETITQAVLGRIRELIPCQRASVALVDSAAEEAVVFGVDVDTGTLREAEIHVPFDGYQDVFETLMQGGIARWGDLRSRHEPAGVVYAEGVRSFVSVPLISQDELIGALSFGLVDPGEFADEHEGIARQMADQLAIAIQQARLHDQVGRHAEELEQRVADRTRELSVLYEVAALASRSLDLETTLARSLDQVLAAVESDAGAIHLLNEAGEISVDGTSEGERLRMIVQRGIPPDIAVQLESLPSGEGLSKWLVEHEEPLIIPDITSDPRLNMKLPIEPHAYVGIPLRVGGRTSAVLSVVRRVDQPRFNVEELSLLTSVADQLGIVVESARLRKRAEQAAALEERERLARDLHDSVTQLLYSVNLFARSARNAHDLGDVDELDRCLIEMGEAGQQALKEMRLMVYELRPRALEREGLIGAIQHRLDAVEGRVGVTTQLIVGEMIELPQRIEQDLYHIIIEALNNALKHAKATSVIVSLDVDRGQVRLEVTDDGAGFDPRAVEDKGGLGIVGMRERAKRLGGTLQVISAPGEGTTVSVELVETRRDL